MNSVAREISRIKRQASELTDNLRLLESLLVEGTKDSTNSSEKEVILIEEMAEILGKSTFTIRRRIKAGKLTPIYQDGSTYFWLRSELTQVLKSGSK